MYSSIHLVNFAVSEFGHFFQDFENIFDFSISTLFLKLFDKMSNFSLKKWSMIEQTSVNVEKI